MSLMRHSDMRLTMSVYTDPRVFDLAGAFEKLPTLSTPAPGSQSSVATGTDGHDFRRSESISSRFPANARRSAT
jgi:hypothetical protein